MTEEQYNTMVELLIQATQIGKLKWKEEKKGFSTIVNECPIKIYPDYDTFLGSSVYSLALANPQGVVFNTYSIDELSDKSGYDRLNELYVKIKDSIYQISESEQKIMDGLEALVQR